MEIVNGSEVIGTGLVNYRAGDILQIMGLKTGQIRKKLGAKPYDEVIHRDNLTVTRESEAPAPGGS